jgi:intracellular multiplication protein IcmJ
MASQLPFGQSSHAMPAPGLGASFERAPKRALEFSARASVAGERAPVTWEPTPGGEDEISLQALRNAVLHRDGDCVFCGSHTATLQLDTVNDNHHDVSIDNHVAADPLCHGYHHLDALAETDARLAYLPGLDRTDVNLLQRVAIGELFCGDEQARADARDVINWLASHHRYATDTLGTATPSVLGAALSRADPGIRLKRGAVFEDLALIFNPARMREHAGVWHRELLDTHPRSAWAQVFEELTGAVASQG